MDQLNTTLASLGLPFNPAWLLMLAPIGAILIQMRSYLSLGINYVGNALVGRVVIDDLVFLSLMLYLREKYKVYEIGQILYIIRDTYSFAERKDTMILAKTAQYGDGLLDFLDEKTRIKLATESEGYSPAQVRDMFNKEAILYFHNHKNKE